MFLDWLLASAIDEGRRPIASLRTAMDSKKPEGENLARRSGLPAIFTMLNKCKPPIVLQLFLSAIAGFIRLSLREGNPDPREIEVFSRWTVSIREASDSAGIYNIGAQASLERLFQALKDGT
jgi:hypothetical protein